MKSVFFSSEFYCRLLTNSESPVSKDFSISCQLTHFPESNFCGVLILISIINMTISMANTIQIGRVRFPVFSTFKTGLLVFFFSSLVSLVFVLVFLSMTKLAIHLFQKIPYFTLLWEVKSTGFVCSFLLLLCNPITSENVVVQLNFETSTSRY